MEEFWILIDNFGGQETHTTSGAPEMSAYGLEKFIVALA